MEAHRWEIPFNENNRIKPYEEEENYDEDNNYHDGDELSFYRGNPNVRTMSDGHRDNSYLMSSNWRHEQAATAAAASTTTKRERNHQPESTPRYQVRSNVWSVPLAKEPNLRKPRGVNNTQRARNQSQTMNKPNITKDGKAAQRSLNLVMQTLHLQSQPVYRFLEMLLAALGGYATMGDLATLLPSDPSWNGELKRYENEIWRNQRATADIQLSRALATLERRTSPDLRKVVMRMLEERRLDNFDPAAMKKALRDAEEQRIVEAKQVEAELDRIRNRVKEAEKRILNTEKDDNRNNNGNGMRQQITTLQQEIENMESRLAGGIEKNKRSLREMRTVATKRSKAQGDTSEKAKRALKQLDDLRKRFDNLSEDVARRLDEQSNQFNRSLLEQEDELKKTMTQMIADMTRAYTSADEDTKVELKNSIDVLQDDLVQIKSFQSSITDSVESMWEERNYLIQQLNALRNEQRVENQATKLQFNAFTSLLTNVAEKTDQLNNRLSVLKNDIEDKNGEMAQNISTLQKNLLSVVENIFDQGKLATEELRTFVQNRLDSILLRLKSLEQDGESIRDENKSNIIERIDEVTEKFNQLYDTTAQEMAEEQNKSNTLETRLNRLEKVPRQIDQLQSMLNTILQSNAKLTIEQQNTATGRESQRKGLPVEEEEEEQEEQDEAEQQEETQTTPSFRRPASISPFTPATYETSGGGGGGGGGSDGTNRAARRRRRWNEGNADRDEETALDSDNEEEALVAGSHALIGEKHTAHHVLHQWLHRQRMFIGNTLNTRAMTTIGNSVGSRYEYEEGVAFIVFRPRVAGAVRMAITELNNARQSMQSSANRRPLEFVPLMTSPQVSAAFAQYVAMTMTRGQVGPPFGGSGSGSSLWKSTGKVSNASQRPIFVQSSGPTRYQLAARHDTFQAALHYFSHVEWIPGGQLTYVPPVVPDRHGNIGTSRVNGRYQHNRALKRSRQDTFDDMLSIYR